MGMRRGCVVLSVVVIGGAAGERELNRPEAAGDDAEGRLAVADEMGMALYIGLPDRGAISLFELWNIFDSVLAK